MLREVAVLCPVGTVVHAGGWICERLGDLVLLGSEVQTIQARFKYESLVDNSVKVITRTGIWR
jgi:hypothetical protein